MDSDRTGQPAGLPEVYVIGDGGGTDGLVENSDRSWTQGAPTTNPKQPKAASIRPENEQNIYY